MKLYAIKKDYIKFLKQYEHKVPNINYGDRLKPFIGIVFHTTSGYSYFCPISSYKPKFEKMNDMIDFIKIKDSNKKILCAVNINNMFPVPNNEVTEITENILSSLRTFETDEVKQLYWNLLRKELSIINSLEDKIQISAEKVYWIQANNPMHPLHTRCLNFTLLDEKCKEYEITKALERFPYEGQNKHIVNQYLSLKEGKSTYEFNSKIYLIKSNHVDLSLSELSKLYGDSFFDLEFDSYAQIIYRNIDEIIAGIKECVITLSDSEKTYMDSNDQNEINNNHSTFDLYEEDLEYQK